MKLREFLNELDFDYEVDEEGIHLIDLQGANLGDIESEVFNNTDEVIDRLNIYYYDYFISDLEYVLEDEFNIDCSKLAWDEMYHKLCELIPNYRNEFIECIIGDMEVQLY